MCDSYKHKLALLLLALILCPACNKQRSTPTLASPKETAPLLIQPDRSIEFSEIVAGFKSCTLPDLYVDATTGKPAHPFFAKHQLTPCKIDEHLTYYCVDEQFYGLHVTKFAIPSGTWPIYALFFDVDIEAARAKLSGEFDRDLRPSQESKSGIAPELILDPESPLRSALVCEKEF